MKKRVIFTVADARYIHLFAKMFYPTLRRFGRYQGDVKVVVLGPVDPTIREELARRDLLFQADEDYTDLNMLWKFEYAARLQEEYEEIYFYDCDVWFQEDINGVFEFVKPGRLSVCEGQARYQRELFLSDSGYHEKNMNALIATLSPRERERIIQGLTGRHVINGGFFGGGLLSSLYKAYLQSCNDLPHFGWGFNQASVNLWSFRFPETINRIPAKYNVALTNPRGKLSNGPGGLTMLDSQPAVVVHANNRDCDQKLDEPRFVRFVEAHPELRAGLDV